MGLPVQSIYKVLIVDDEYVIRDGLMSFKWWQYGFKAVGTASDGIEALENMAKEQVDLVITDIKMPLMDGLELSENIHQKYPEAKIIILTGYKDFEYAQKAIRSGVAGYLLKPVDIDELESLITEVKTEFDKQKDTTLRIDSYEKQFKGIVPLAVENFFRGLVEGRINNTLEIEETMNLLEIYLKRPYYACAVFQFQSTVPEEINDLESNDLKRLVGDTLNDYYELNNIGYFYFSSDTEALLIFNFDMPDPAIPTYEFLINTVSEAKSAIETKSQGKLLLNINAGVGNIYNNITYISVSAQQAYKALERKFFDEINSIFYAWKEKNTQESAIINYPYEKEGLMIDAILEGNTMQCTECLKNFWEDFQPVLRHMDKNKFTDIALQLSNMLERSLNKRGTSINKIIHFSVGFSDHIKNTQTISELKQCIESLFTKSAEYINEINCKVKSSSYAAVKQAIKYIGEHYNEKITMNEVAEKVYLNPSYFSIQFKKEMGKNFVDYIKEIRIKKAKELMKRIDLKAYEISEIVGYHDYKYFTEIFKELTGFSPIEFRQNLLIP